LHKIVNSGTYFLDKPILLDLRQTGGNSWMKMFVFGRVWEAKLRFNGVQHGSNEKKGCFEGTSDSVDWYKSAAGNP